MWDFALKLQEFAEFVRSGEDFDLIVSCMELVANIPAQESRRCCLPSSSLGD